MSLAYLSGANLIEEDPSASSNLGGADLSGADLGCQDLVAANMKDANLIGANLSEADLSGADLTNSKMGSTMLGAIDFSQVKGLDTVEHYSPSSVGIDTIFRSQGQIPNTFLRGAGVPEVFIVKMRSLVADMSPTDFYSCFISYSSKDQEFAERLYADLQGKGVRCWYAPEDLKIGDKFRQRIDDAIRLHDKLLVVLSETSVASSWVESEVEAAFAKRTRRRKQNRALPDPAG